MAWWSKGRIQLSFCKSGDMEGLSPGIFRKDAVQNISLPAESFRGSGTSIGRDAMIPHRRTRTGEHDETDLDQV
jgi:hypothetical protein